MTGSDDAGAVHVVEHEQQGPGVLVRWASKPSATGRRRPRTRRRARPGGPAPQPARCVPNPAAHGPGDLAVATAGHRPGVTQPRQLRLPPDERRVRAQRRRQPAALGQDDCQRRVLFEHLALDARSAGPGLQPERLGEHSSGAGTRPGVVLASERVEAAHEQRPRSFSTGFGGHQSFELRNRAGRGAGEQLGLGEVLGGCQAQLLEADPLGIGEGAPSASMYGVPRQCAKASLKAGRAERAMLGQLGAGGVDEHSNRTASTAAGSMSSR